MVEPDYAEERARLCTLADLTRWWSRESAEQRERLLAKSREDLRTLGFSEAEIETLIADLAEVLDANASEGFARLGALRDAGLVGGETIN
jgi:uncharacterized protein YjiS (DUF1127 family)